MTIAYLDNAATTRLHPRVVEVLERHSRETYGNPSSLHAGGRVARRVIEDSRERIAARLGADPKEIYFTSCATESNNWAIRGVWEALRGRGNHVVTTQVEHPAVLEPCAEIERRGGRVTRVGVDAEGRVDPAEIEAAVTPETVLISLMWANNEVGTLQPVRKIARRKRTLLHTDAAQAIGKVAVDLDGIDLMTFSAHKIHGPKGVGALFLRKGTPIAPGLVGGGQEFGRRAGTENVPLIAAFAEAVDLAVGNLTANASRMERLRDRLEGELGRIPHTTRNGPSVDRLPGILNLSFEGVDGEAMILALDAEGVEVSSGSACASLSMEPSHVLAAMGVPADLARASVRFSVAADTGDEEVDLALEKVPAVVERLRKISPAYPR